MTAQTAAKHTHEPNITISINAQHYVVHSHELTGAELGAIAGIPESGNQIFLEVSGRGDDQPVAASESVKLHDGIKFYDVPVGNLG